MKATEKIDAYGRDALAKRLGVDPVTVYRWRKALESGIGVSAKNARRLVEATADSPAPINFADFLPGEARP